MYKVKNKTKEPRRSFINGKYIIFKPKESKIVNSIDGVNRVVFDIEDYVENEIKPIKKKVETNGKSR